MRSPYTEHAQPYSLTERKLLFEMFTKGHNTKIIQARVIVLVLCMLTHDVLYLCKASWKYLKWFSSYRVETVICNVQMGIAPKLYQPELWFLHSAYCLMMFYICVKFRIKNHESFSSYRAETVIYNVQRGITPKLYKPKGTKSNSSELLCLSWLPATLMMIRSKMNELAWWRDHFPIISLWEFF